MIYFLSMCDIYIMCNYLANVTRKRFDCNGILFVFDKLHTMHNWARGYLSEMVQTSSFGHLTIYMRIFLSKTMNSFGINW